MTLTKAQLETLCSIVQVLWSPAPQWCEDTLERRLATMADRLHINFGIGGGANSYASSTSKHLRITAMMPHSQDNR